MSPSDLSRLAPCDRVAGAGEVSSAQTISSADSLLSAVARSPLAATRAEILENGSDRLAPAAARSDFEAAVTSVRFEVHRNCNAEHEQNFAPEQNVGLVEIAVPRSRRSSLVGGHSDAGHEATAPAQHHDQ